MKPTLIDSINSIFLPETIKVEILKCHQAEGRKLTCPNTLAFDFDWGNSKKGAAFWTTIYCNHTYAEKKHNFISYLEDTLIPDLIESGSEAMAEDFKTCIQYMR